MIASINPATGETLRTFEALTDAQVDDKIARADAAYRKLPADLIRGACRLAQSRGRNPGIGEGPVGAHHDA